MEDLIETMEFFKRNRKNKDADLGEEGASSRAKTTSSKNTGHPPGFSTPTPTHLGTINEHLQIEEPRCSKQLPRTGGRIAVFSSPSESSVQAHNHQVRPPPFVKPNLGFVQSTAGWPPSNAYSAPIPLYHLYYINISYLPIPSQTLITSFITLITRSLTCKLHTRIFPIATLTASQFSCTTFCSGNTTSPVTKS